MKVYLVMMRNFTLRSLEVSKNVSGEGEMSRDRQSIYPLHLRLIRCEYSLKSPTIFQLRTGHPEDNTAPSLFPF